MSESTAGPSEPKPVDVADEPFALSGSEAGDDDAKPQGPVSRTRLIVLGVLLVLGLAGAAVIGWTAWRITSQKDATLTVPPQVAGLKLDESANAQTTAEYLTNAIAADVDLDETVGAVYTDPAAANRSVLFFGGTTLIWTPGSDLDTAFELISDEEGAVTGLHEVPTGDLGGTMKCGTTASGDGNMAVCGWADHGSLALAMFPNRSEADSAALLREIRAEAQTRE
ncbi:hypothetical protein [Jidongwangia harbinensis]|uniref:hypothetical protein n=1 Tax=Jidongwangia harbinensis TaxID=2878561 RepID=UPI001CD9EBC7|nr:hypothetical protein [Jidongwangia harbinensis]MCA2217919.1 hypothetical protein [Jidongwangia harbinensis]